MDGLNSFHLKADNYALIVFVASFMLVILFLNYVLVLFVRWCASLKIRDFGALDQSVTMPPESRC